VTDMVLINFMLECKLSHTAFL